jgi:hypothetical protein
MAQGTSGRVGEPVPCLASRPPGLTVAAVIEGVRSIWTKRSGRSVKSVRSNAIWKLHLGTKFATLGLCH